MGCDTLGVFVNPAFARCPFAVLFGRPVLRHAVLGGQGDDLRLSWANDARCDGSMVREGLAIGELTGEAVVAMHGLRRKVVGAIQGHQPLVAKAPKMRQQAMLFKALEDLNKYRIEGAWGDRIAQLSDLIITGNLLHAQQGVGVILALVLLQGALVVQKRRRLGQELRIPLCSMSPEFLNLLKSGHENAS